MMTPKAWTKFWLLLLLQCLNLERETRSPSTSPSSSLPPIANPIISPSTTGRPSLTFHLRRSSPMANAAVLLLVILPGVATASSLSFRPIDGDISEAYNNSVQLDDGKVTFFWTLFPDSISIAARSEKKSGYLAIAFGEGMVNSYAYVGWMDAAGQGRVSTYWIDGKEASKVHPTGEKLAGARFRSEKGFLSLEFRLPLSPASCIGRVECGNVVDPSAPLRVVWARGARWSDGDLSWSNKHGAASDRAVGVQLIRGSIEQVEGVPLALAFHGFLMLLSWGILFPCGMLAARYLRHEQGLRWFQLHLRLQYFGLVFAALAILLAAAELRGLVLSSAHAAVGMVAMAMAFAQPINASLRPKEPAIGEFASRTRILWSYIHFWVGRSAILVGIVAVLSGLKYVADAYDSEIVDGLTWAFMLWVLVGVLVVLLMEYSEMKRRRTDHNTFGSRIVLKSNDEDCSVDLLHQKTAEPSRREVQLEPLNY